MDPCSLLRGGLAWLSYHYYYHYYYNNYYYYNCCYCCYFYTTATTTTLAAIPTPIQSVSVLRGGLAWFRIRLAANRRLFFPGGCGPSVLGVGQPGSQRLDPPRSSQEGSRA